MGVSNRVESYKFQTSSLKIYMIDELVLYEKLITCENCVQIIRRLKHWMVSVKEKHWAGLVGLVLGMGIIPKSGA